VTSADFLAPTIWLFTYHLSLITFSECARRGSNAQPTAPEAVRFTSTKFAIAILLPIKA